MPTETYTSDDSLDIPAGVDEVELELLGGAGEDGNGQAPGNGENGGRVFGTLSVTDTDTLYFRFTPGGLGTATGTNGGDGGDGADVRLNGTTLSDRIAAAGGGGGGGASNNNFGAGDGGAGGADTGEDGDADPLANNNPGEGGTQAAAGAGFASGSGPNGGDTDSGQFAGGGGGGSGYFGGGAGEAVFDSETDEGAAGGGGGSNYDDGLTTTDANLRGANEGTAEIVVSYLDPPNEPSDVSQDVQDGDTAEVTLTPNNPDSDPEEYEYERSLDGGAYTAVTTTTNTTVTDSYPSSADSIQYRARATNDAGTSDWVETATETTNAKDLTVVDTRESEIDLSWTDPSANDGTDVLLADTSGSVAGDYTVEESLGPSEGSTTLTGLENGETYYARVQATYTGADGTPAPVSNEVSTTTEPVPPTLDALDTATVGEITLAYTLLDNSPDGDVEIERSDDGGETFTTIDTVSDLQATEYTDTTVTPGDQYTYRLTRNTTDTSVQSNTLTDYAEVDPPEGQGLVLQGGGTTQVLDPDEIVAKDLVLVHSGVGDGRIDVPQNDAIIPRTQRHDRIFYYVNGECEWTGYAVGFAGNERTGRWTLRVTGVGLRLEETRPDYEALGGPLVYTNIALDEALKDYWPRTPFNATVTDQVPELVAEDEELQSADSTAEWESVYTPADTDPFVIQNGNLELAQSNYLSEAEDATTLSGPSTVLEADEYSDGAYIEFDTTGDKATWEFTTEYTIPEAAVSFYVRDFGVDMPEVEFRINDSTVDTIPPNAQNTGDLGWKDVAEPFYDIDEGGYTGGDLDPGTHTLEIEATAPPQERTVEGEEWTAEFQNQWLTEQLEYDNIETDSETVYDGGTTYTRGTDYEMNYSAGEITPLDGGSITDGQTLQIDYTVLDEDGFYQVDLVALLDNRFDYTFDNDNGGSEGYLDGPELYPDESEALLQSVTTAYNIPSATITTTFNDTSGTQAIAVSNDNGANFLESSNTATDTFNFSTSGRQAVVRFTLGRYGSRTTATPQQGFNGQVIEDYTLDVDLNDLVVIDRLELSRDHFANLKTLHDYGDFLWVIEHDDGDLDTLTVSSFMRGQETRTAPFAFLNPANRQPEVAAENYFNSVYLEGALQSDGTRPTAEVKDVPANEREITPGVLRDQNVSTEAGAQFRANALLQSALENNELRGTIETHPTYVSVGYSYPVDFGSGTDEKTLESLSITESAGEVSATAEFVTREALSQTISELKRSSRDIGNQV